MVILSISLYFLTEHTIFEMWVAKYELCTVILRLSASFALFFSYARNFQIAFFCFHLHHKVLEAGQLTSLKRYAIK